MDDIDEKRSKWSKDNLNSGDAVFLSKEALSNSRDTIHVKRKNIDRKSSPTMESCSNISDVDPPSMPPSPPLMNDLVDDSRVTLQKSPDPIKAKGRRDHQVLAASPQAQFKPYSHIKSKVGSLIPSSNYKKPAKASKGSVSFSESAASPEQSARNMPTIAPIAAGSDRRASYTAENTSTNPISATARKPSLTGGVSKERPSSNLDVPKPVLPASHVNAKWSEIDFQDFDITGEIAGVENSPKEREARPSDTGINATVSSINEQDGRRKSDLVRTREPPVAISPPAKGSSRALPNLHQHPSWSKIDFPAGIFNEFQAPSDTVASASPEKSENDNYKMSNEHLVISNHETPHGQTQISLDINPSKIEATSFAYNQGIVMPEIKVSEVDSEALGAVHLQLSRKKSLSHSSISIEADTQNRDISCSSSVLGAEMDTSKIEQRDLKPKNPLNSTKSSPARTETSKAKNPVKDPRKSAKLINPEELAEKAKKSASSRLRSPSRLSTLIDPKELAELAYKITKGNDKNTTGSSLLRRRALSSPQQGVKENHMPKNLKSAQEPIENLDRNSKPDTQNVIIHDTGKMSVDPPLQNTAANMGGILTKDHIKMLTQEEAKKCAHEAIDKFKNEVFQGFSEKIDAISAKLKKLESENSRIHQDWDSGVLKMFNTRLHNLEQSVINLSSSLKEKSANETSNLKTIQALQRNGEILEARITGLEKLLLDSMHIKNERPDHIPGASEIEHIRNRRLEDEVSKLKLEIKEKVDISILKQLAKHIASIDDVKLLMDKTKRHVKKSVKVLETALKHKISNDDHQQHKWKKLVEGYVESSVKRIDDVKGTKDRDKVHPYSTSIMGNEVIEGNIKRDIKSWIELELRGISHGSKERHMEIIESLKKQIDTYLKEQADLMHQKHENYLQDQATFHPILQQLKREYDEKLFVLCSDISSCKNLFTKQFNTPFYRCAQWVWHSGQLKLKSGVPWNLQTSNTDPDNFKWTKDHMNIRVEESGIYQISLAFFTRSKPSIQLVVNGNSVLSALHSPSYVVHHPGYSVNDGMDHGTVTGASLIVK